MSPDTIVHSGLDTIFMAQTPQEFIKRLSAISLHNGREFGRLQLLFGEESRYREIARNYRGYWSLSDAFKCFFLETAESINAQPRPPGTQALSEHYGLMVLRITNQFRYICGAEHLAEYGYPLPALTVVRNISDSLVLTSGALQGFTDFYSIEGVTPGQPSSSQAAKKLRKLVERSVTELMTGAKSGLSQRTQDDLKLVDSVYDYEVHGAGLSLAGAVSYLKGWEGLTIVPKFDERQLAAFLNRMSEVEWMLHRLLPLLQPPFARLPVTWADKWRLIDDSFKYLVNELTAQLGKTIGASVVEFVESKFPFNEGSAFSIRA
jgi:hypothetical protein